MNAKLEETVCALLDALKFRIEEESQPPKKDFLDRSKVIAQWVATIAIPVVVAVYGQKITQSENSK